MSQMKRRDFLKASAAAAAGLAVGVSSTAQPEPPMQTPPEGPIDPEEASKLLRGALSHNPPFNDAKFQEEAEKNCDHWPHRLTEVDEGCEVLMSLLWKGFALGALANAIDVHYDAMLLGRSRIRDAVFADVKGACNPSNGTLCSLPQNLVDKYRTHWLGLGTNAAKLADPGNTGEATILLGHFSKAWDDTFGTNPTPSKQLGYSDEATEVIGSHLWFQFALGSRSGHDKEFDVEAVRAGRDHSRLYVYMNVHKFGVTDGNTEPKYSEWKWDLVGGCANDCGWNAARHAHIDNGSTTIKSGHFHDGWCQTKEAVKRLFRRRKEDYRARSAGCG